jgi:histidyl-tRNA synthetase
MAYGGRALKTAMRAADASGARIALVLGDREIEEDSVMVRNLRSGEQNPCALGDVVEVVRSVLATG